MCDLCKHDKDKRQGQASIFENSFISENSNNVKSNEKEGSINIFLMWAKSRYDLIRSATFMVKAAVPGLQQWSG